MPAAQAVFMHACLRSPAAIRRTGILSGMSPSSSGSATESESESESTDPASQAPPTADRRSGDRLPPSGYLLAAAVLVGSLLLVALYWQHARERELRAAQAEFVAEAAETVALVRQRLIQFELTTRGGVALFGTVARPTPGQWKAYVDAIDIGQRFPAMVGLGFADYVSHSGLTALQRQYRDSGYGLLEVRPRGVRAQYGPILYLEPKTPENIRAIGFDMYARPVRRAAMEAARDSGQARLSGSVHLVQDSGNQSAAAVLLYAPVYRAGDVPGNRAARRLSMQGWVYAPFRMRRFVESALVATRRDLRFSVRDVTGGGDTLLYADPPRSDTAPPAFVHSALADVHGRLWRFDFQSAPLAVAAPQLATIRTTALVGVLASLLLFGLALLLARTEARARAIAGRMTENYRRSELRFRNALQYSAIGMALLDHDGRIVQANAALGRIVGRGPDSLVGMSFDGLFDDEDEAREQPGHGTSMQAQSTQDATQAIADGTQRVTRQLHRSGGELRYAQLTFAPIPGKLDQDVTRLVQVEDATQRLQAEAQVRALNRTLEARVVLRTRELNVVNRELETFAYSVSHDLRAPLRSIEGFSRLLADNQGARLDDAGRDHLDRIRKAAARMGELIDSILKMSRLGRGDLKPVRVDLSRIAAEVVAELRRDQPEREVDVVIAPELTAHCDPTLLRNLMQNLLDNAWKFTRGREGARIEFGAGTLPAATDREDGNHAFFVRDNGAGFAPEYADKLFRPFQRLHSQEDFSGHGIGLASVKRVIDRHGGQLRAEGRVGEGATFWFTLPEHAEA